MGSSSEIDPRLSLAIAAGRLAALASRRLGGGGGTALPGVVATRLDPDLLGKLASRLRRGTTLVTGTNGKTTTSRLVATMLDHVGWKPVHNRSGSNLLSGLTAATLGRSSLLGVLDGDCGLFEVDEAVMPRILGAVRPRVVTITNLFRDQLDRYGEIDFVARRWREAVQTLPPEATLVLNADDPGVAALGRDTHARVLYYGIDAPADGDATLGHVADSKDCPFCGAPLCYETLRYAHVGTYRCPSGDFARPALDVAATAVTLKGIEQSDLDVIGPFGVRSWQFRLPGLYNVYNLLAAVTSAVALELPVAALDAAVEGARAAFGRLERIPVGDRALFFALIKNPVGLTEVLRTIMAEPGDKHLALVINDNLADGTDVSWLWDAEIEPLATRCRQVSVSGTRAGDIALRLKYAGVPVDRLRQAESLERLLDAGLAEVPSGGTLYVLPTYTAMLELRALVSRRGYASRFWES